MTSISPIISSPKLASNPSQNPKFSVSVKKSSGEKLELADPRATRAMLALMDMQAVLGGAASHWGGPSAFAELMSALHGLVFHEAKSKGQNWHERFHLINDAGHCENGIYALKANYGFADLNIQSLKGFRSIQSRLTGHGEVHLFPEGVYLSNGPLGSSLPQAQGLAMADAYSGRERVTVTAISDGACMEGEAREALASIPGLASRGQLAPFVLVISDNNTKLSGRIDQESFSMQPTFDSLSSLGWNVLNLSDAHTLETCVHTIELAIQAARENPKRPVAIHAKTIKGFGVEKTASSLSGGHGFPLKEPSELKAFLEEIYKGDSVPQVFTDWRVELEEQVALKSKGGSSGPKMASEKVQVGIAKALIRAREEGLPVISVTSDLPGSTGLADFHKKFKDACFDVGVAESNMVSVAAGFSKEGFIPVVDTFAQFGVTKGALPFIMAALSEAPIIGIFSHIGFQDAADGASHQALSYFAMTSSIPHTDVYCLGSSAEAEALLGKAIRDFARDRQSGNIPRSKIFFLGRENFPPSYLPMDASYELGRAQVLINNSAKFSKSVTLAVTGPLIPEALKAVENLAKEDIGCVLINPSIINQPDVETFTDALNLTSGRLLTVEDHQLSGGMGSLLTHALMLSHAGIQKVISLGVCDEFGQSAYTALELYQKHGLDSEAIQKSARRLVQ